MKNQNQMSLKETAAHTAVAGAITVVLMTGFYAALRKVGEFFDEKETDDIARKVKLTNELIDNASKIEKANETVKAKKRKSA